MFNSFIGDVKVEESTFEVQTGGSTYLDVGKHEVTIIDIEPALSTGGFKKIIITFSDAEGKTYTDHVVIIGKAGTFLRGYTQLGTLISPEDGLRKKYLFDFLGKDVKNFSSMVGLRAAITIAEPRNGFTVTKNTTGLFFVADVEKKDKEGNLVPIDSETFMDRKEAVQHGKDLGMYRAFPRLSWIEGSDVEANTKAVLKAIGGGTKVAPIKASGV